MNPLYDRTGTFSCDLHRPSRSPLVFIGLCSRKISEERKKNSNNLINGNLLYIWLKRNEEVVYSCKVNVAKEFKRNFIRHLFDQIYTLAIVFYFHLSSLLVKRAWENISMEIVKKFWRMIDFPWEGYGECANLWKKISYERVVPFRRTPRYILSYFTIHQTFLFLFLSKWMSFKIKIDVFPIDIENRNVYPEREKNKEKRNILNWFLKVNFLRVISRLVNYLQTTDKLVNRFLTSKLLLC